MHKTLQSYFKGFDELQLLLYPLSQQLKCLAISCWSYEYVNVSNSTALINKNDVQRYYSNVESLILINHLSNNNDRSSQIIDDLCHTIDLTKIKSLKFDKFDYLQSTSLLLI
ncbi:unnamed protein product [Rotaria sordida]|uniref:Uncharacterized protein n=1 Tax=Rotaria sordida TaxID=392033 RepID=A0A814MTK4_9BILA|nr:unnamed protein product [Rotaria sordida]CAF1362201.1 unnamed protein product [Rotaria sordida]